MSLECFWTCFQPHSRLAQGFISQGWEAAAVGGLVSPGAELDTCSVFVTQGCQALWKQLVAAGSFSLPRWTRGPGSLSTPSRAWREIAGGGTVFGGWLGRELSQTKCVCLSEGCTVEGLDSPQKKPVATFYLCFKGWLETLFPCSVSG